MKQQAHINSTGTRAEKKMDQAKKVIDDTLARVKSGVAEAKTDVDSFKLEAEKGATRVEKLRVREFDRSIGQRAVSRLYRRL